MKLPKSFKLFSTTIKVKRNNKSLNDQNVYGQTDYEKNRILLSKTCGVNKLSRDRVLDTFYHEKTHTVLHAMGEDDLCKNEKFVDLLARLWRQSDETAKY